MTEITGLEGLNIRVGDIVTIPNMFRPRWWQLWKRWPFASRKPKTYRVVNVSTNSIGCFEE